MTNPTSILTTRASLSATASHNARWFASLLAGSAMLGAPALAVGNFWDSDTPPGSTDWNTAGNWSEGRVPANPNGAPTGENYDDAIVNDIDPAYPILTASPAASVRDVKVGVNDLTTGRLDIRAGTLIGAGWAVVGDNGGSGTLNIANTAASGGTFTGFGLGSASFQAGFRLYVGGEGTGAAAGTANVNTSGTIGMSEELVVGNGSGTGGTLNFDNGTINVGGQTWFGQGGGGVGKLRMSGGTLNSNSWMAIGREGGTGTVEMSGGTWNRNGGAEAFIVGSSGVGEMTMTGGTVNVSPVTWIAEGSGANGSKLTLGGSAIFNTPIMSVGPEGTGTLELNGGTLRTGRITGKRASATGGGTEADGGVGTINFNGSQIVATAPNSAFIADVNVLNVAAGGLRIDSNGFDVGVPAVLSGAGGVLKSGAGTLSLGGANDFIGASTVTGGTLNVSTDSTGGGAFTATDATLGAVQAIDAGVLQMSSLTLTNGALAVTAATGVTGNPTAAPIKVNGPLTRTGQIAINLIDDQPAVGQFPVVAYTSKPGTGTFVPGKLPLGVTLTAGTPIVDSGSVISLNIARVNAPYWIGSGGGVWNTTTASWQNLYTGGPTTYMNGDPAVFEDLVTSPVTYDVILNSTVSPGAGGVIFDNDLDDFTLTGTGKISGTTGLIKRGFGGLTIGNLLNDFTGPVTIEEGVVSVGLLGNAGSPSPLGAGNLVLAGGTLNYTGPAVSVTRGFDINAPTNTTPSELVIASNVTMSGPVTATAGKFRLSGAGVLTLSHGGVISLANGPQDAEPASLVIDGKGLTINGVGQTANVIGNTQIGVANGATTALTVAGNAILNLNRFQVGFGVGSTPSVLIQDSARIHKSATGWLSIGNSNDSVATVTVRNSGSLISDGGDFNIGDTGTSNGTLTLENSAAVTSIGPVFIGKNGTRGAVNLSGSSTMSSGLTEVAGGGGSQGSLNVVGTSTYTSNGALLVGPGVDSAGVVTIDGSGSFQGNTYVSVGFNGGGTMTIKGDGSFNNSDDLSVNENGAVPALVTVQDTGSLAMGANLYIGRNGTRVGTLTVSGSATVDQTNAASNFFVGLAGDGTLNISGTAAVTAGSANGVVLGQDASGVGTVNLNGGTLTGKRVFGNSGTSTFNFNGGLLRAGAGANPDFMAGVDNALVNAGGARIDSNGQNIAINQPLLVGTTAGGGLTKSGAGTLRLSGVNTYTGATTVSGGNLGGTTTIAGPLVVQTGAGIEPGAVTGTLTANGGVTFSSGSKFLVNIDDSQTADNGLLATTGNLNVTGVALQVNLAGPGALPSYTIATAGSVTGPFASVPAGVNVTYNANSITITPPTATPFQSWINGFAVNGQTGAAQDPDSDGVTNLEEFALDGNPANGNATGKVRSRIETVGGQQALVITLPVRVGAIFDNTPGPGADATVVADDVVYLIRGSNDLVNYNQGVTEIAPSTSNPNMPGLSDPTKWGYRTFRLTGAIPARGPRGFLDIEIQDAP
ncbi:autotransporter-associated beta strand repeat-containing protein [Luteolibacter arcticus]|uniref:Autotransporter-associated beta strand repeat-containing protein n=1 Tax=Luteolibacter arcticus TaxID=1581411 RepID=A0ABT3GJT2_9BACT|nr:autotransporter-associated beta strand repeat-containing protein [Luteolibacter arcticus]MCW1923767.1 autotransporter-associated beta strand repeat-containing protein [Luteolibacter arcticus]